MWAFLKPIAKCQCKCSISAEVQQSLDLIMRSLAASGKKIDDLAKQVTALTKQGDKFMSKIDDLKAAVDAETLDIHHVGDAVAAAATGVAALIANAQASNDPALDSLIKSLQDHHADLTAIADAAGKIVPATPAPVPAPTGGGTPAIV